MYHVPIGTFRTRRLFGLDFVDAPAVADVVDRLLSADDVNIDMWRCVVTPNVDHLVRYERHEDEADIARSAYLVLPDGMPIVWASRLLSRPLAARLAGSDLFASLWPRLADAGVSTVVVAPRWDVADRLSAEHPAARFVVPPVFDAADSVTVASVVDAIVDACEGAGARFLVIGLSMSKHHSIAAQLRVRWAGTYGSAPTVLLLGAASELYLGVSRRAPMWMQRAGLEWLHRLLGDPRRLAKRYLVDDVQFLPLVWREWRRRRRLSAAE